MVHGFPNPKPQTPSIVRFGFGVLFLVLEVEGCVFVGCFQLGVWCLSLRVSAYSAWLGLGFQD